MNQSIEAQLLQAQETVAKLREAVADLEQKWAVAIEARKAGKAYYAMSPLNPKRAAQLGKAKGWEKLLDDLIWPPRQMTLDEMCAAEEPARENGL